jgi:hypothetical protein
MHLFNAHIQPGATYQCHKQWTNEMRYKWKTGERVLVVNVLPYSIGVKSPRDPQYFEIALEKFNDNFKMQ